MMPINVRSAVRRFYIVGALAMITGLGLASAASATTPVWSQNGTQLQFGKQTSFSSTAFSALNLKWTQSGMDYWIQCESLYTSGTVENPASEKAGTLKATTGAAKFQGCKVIEVGEIQTVWNNTTCSVPKEIPLKYTSGELTNTPYANGGLKLTNIEMEFVISNCPSGFIENLKWRFWGDVTGNEGYGALAGEVQFPEGTPLSMNASGHDAEAEFAMRIQDGGSTPIEIAQEEPPKPAPHLWYAGGGGREGEGPRTVISPGSSVAIKGSGGNIAIEGWLSGIATTVSCSKGTTSGSVENPTGGGDGVASLSGAFTGCTVVKPENKGCYLENNAISIGPLSGVLAAEEQWSPVRFTASTVTTIQMRGCSNPALNNNFPVTGPLFVDPYPSTQNPGWWHVRKGENEYAGLKLGGVKAKAYGSVKAETSGGEVVTWSE